ncbi:hypothetical protein C8250_029045 [Streptomyces sp. So13.3]|uniref:hypothetical protein n=1 Tax=Streptomyces sp. So13.3 TaxID=2136173 RepID=UPI0011061387|nr:hypothetical protein [Streptomyces sp. So13.3]QNA75398.1 hypothetical protein C8250_029045 [Streptomyces sp. So13.3]
MTPPLIHGLFIPPEAQVEQFRSWNRTYRLGFTEADIDAVGEPPAWPEDPLSAVLLHWSLDSPHRTAEYSWRVAAAQQPGSWRLSQILFDSFHLRLLPEIVFTPYQIQWETVHLGAGLYTAPLKERGPQSLHAQGFQAAGYFPHWARAMDGEIAPRIWLAGYELSEPYDGPGNWEDNWNWIEGHAWLHGFQIPAECYPDFEWEYTLRMGWCHFRPDILLGRTYADSPIPGFAVPYTDQPSVPAKQLA